MSQSTLISEAMPTPDDQTIRRELIQQGYANLPFALGSSACSDLFASFADFAALCDEPGGDQLRAAVRYDANNLGNGKYFMEHRVPGRNVHEPERAPGRDHKRIIHFGARTIEHAQKTLGSALPAEMADFLARCDDFYDQASRVVRQGSRALGLESVLFSTKRADEVHHLRLIDYLATDEPILGEAHFDRAVMTAALCESASGLRGIPGQNGYLVPVDRAYLEALEASLSPIAHREYTAKLFLGAGMNRLPADIREPLQDLPLLLHDIRNEHPGEHRQAAVFFANPHRHFQNFVVPTSTETGINDMLLAAA